MKGRRRTKRRRKGPYVGCFSNLSLTTCFWAISKHTHTHTRTHFEHVSAHCVHTQQVIAALCNRFGVFSSHLSTRASHSKSSQWWEGSVGVVLQKASSHRWPDMPLRYNCENQRHAEERWLMKEQRQIVCVQVCAGGCWQHAAKTEIKNTTLPIVIKSQHMDSKQTLAPSVSTCKPLLNKQFPFPPRNHEDWWPHGYMIPSLSLLKCIKRRKKKTEMLKLSVCVSCNIDDTYFTLCPYLYVCQ